MFTAEFEKDKRAWLKTRPEYRKLIASIKAGESDEMLGTLANDAGIFVARVLELRRLLQSATSPMTKARAAKFRPLEKQLATLTTTLEELDKKLAIASTLQRQDELGGQFYDLVEQRQKLQMQLADATSANSCVEAAREAGVL